MKREELVAARKRNLYTQYGLARELGISQSAYSLIELGYSDPSDSVIVKLSQLLGIPGDYFKNSTERCTG